MLLGVNISCFGGLAVNKNNNSIKRILKPAYLSHFGEMSNFRFFLVSKIPYSFALQLISNLGSAALKNLTN